MKRYSNINIIVLLLGSAVLGGCPGPDDEGLFANSPTTSGSSSSSSSGRAGIHQGVIAIGTGSASTTTTSSSSSSSSSGTGGMGGEGGGVTASSSSSSSSSTSGGTGGMAASSSSSSSTGSTTSSSSGTGGGPTMDGGADAPPPCTAGDFQCSGASPMICNGSGQWVPNGGDCNFGCNVGTGTCNCTAGTSRYTMNAADGCFTDTVTGTTFYVGIQAPSVAQAVCPPGSTVATEAQLKTLLAQQVPATECLSPDVDPALSQVVSQAKGQISSKTPCSGGLLTLNLQDGTESCVSVPNYNFLCAK